MVTSDDTMEKNLNLNSVTSIEVHKGNSDILASVIYKKGKDLLDVIMTIKKNVRT